MYGDVTKEAVARFQREHSSTFELPLDTGEQVDEPTAVLSILRHESTRPQFEAMRKTRN